MRDGGPARGRGLAWGGLGVAAALAAAEALAALAGLPAADMTASRVVPGVALARGFPIYAGEHGGPIIDFMYGPLAALAFTPAALASTPSGALAIAAALNVLWFFAPVIWLHRRLVPGAYGAAGAVAFVLLVCRDPGLAFSAFTVHADAPALGLAALACGALVNPGRPRLGLSAAALAAAVWTKQTVLPLVVVLPLWVAVARDGATVRSYLAWVAGTLAAVTALVLVTFDPAAMLFNMVTLPGRMPWYGESTGGKLAGAWRSLEVLATQAGPVAVLLAATIGVAAPRAGGLRAWVRRDPSAIFCLVAVAMVPAAIVGGAKVGGYLNTHSVTTYFLAAALTLGLARVGAQARDAATRFAPAALLVVLVASALVRPGAVARLLAVPGALAAWDQNPQEQAWAWARAHPGDTYFPWNPLVTLLAENRLDNNEIGAFNRDLAGIPIDDAQWRRHVPPAARHLATRPPAAGLQWLPSPQSRLPEFHTRVDVPDLAGWIVYERRPATGEESP